MSFMTNRRALGGAAIALLALIGLPAMAQERLAIPGTTVSLVPMKGFTAATGFAGLQNPQTKASVLVAELPAEAHPALSTLFGSLDSAKANFAKQNVIVEAREEIDTAAGTVPLLSGSQAFGGVTFDKWMALFKGTKTVMITVQSPDSADLDDDDVEAMLKTVTLGAEPSTADKLGSLPFQVTPGEPFRIVDTFGGSSVLMTSGPLNADPSGKQPMIIVAAQLSGPQGAKAEQLSEAMLKQTRGFADAQVTTREAKRFAGEDGYLLAGTATGGKRFEHYLAVGPDGRFVRLIATAEAGQYDGLKPAIDKIASSIAFKAN